MKHSAQLSALLALAAQQARAALPTTDLAGCQAFAATFANTCSGGNAISDVSNWVNNVDIA